MAHHKKLLITAVTLVLAAAISLVARFELLLAILLLLMLIFALYYFFHDDNQIHHEALKRNVKNYIEEQEAHKWLEHTFAPQTNKYLRKKARTVSIIAGAVLLFIVFFWSFTVMSFPKAVLATAITAIVYSLILIYLHYLPHFFDAFPKNFRKQTNNPWIRGYLTFLPIVLILYIISPYAAVLERGFSVLLTIPYILFFYTVIFVALFCFSYLAVTHEDKK